MFYSFLCFIPSLNLYATQQWQQQDGSLLVRPLAQYINRGGADDIVSGEYLKTLVVVVVPLRAYVFMC
jgi:hypothetical protein